MNAGAYGSEIEGALVSARAVDGVGGIRDLAAADLGFAYRSCAVPADWIFVGGPPAVRTIRRRSAGACRRSATRESTQPIRSRGGSTFANPPAAWDLIDRAGCRGLAIGGAKVSSSTATS